MMTGPNPVARGVPVFLKSHSAARLPQPLLCRVMTCAVGWAVGIVALVWAVGTQADEPPATAPVAERPVAEFLTTHCLECHRGEEAESDFRIDHLNDDFADRRAAAAWIEIRDRVNRGEMPPDDKPQPTADQIRMLSGWITDRLRQAEQAGLSRGGRAVLRRLNRQEYTNTIRDLLKMEFLPGESPRDMLPPDGTVEGFRTVSVGLMIDPSLMQTYYEVARLVAEKAIVDGPPEFPTKTLRMEFEEIQTNRAIDYLCDKPGFECKEDHIEIIDGQTRSFGRLHYGDHRTATPTLGKYRVSVRAAARPGPDGKPVRMSVRQQHPQASRQLVMDVQVDASPQQPEVYTVIVPRDGLGKEWNLQPVDEIAMTNGNPTYQVYANRKIRDYGNEGDFTNAIRYRGRMQLEGGHEQTIIRPDRIDTEKLPMLWLDWIEIEGPLYEQWPPKSHQLLLGETTPTSLTNGQLTEIFTALMNRAYRRPVADDDVKPIVNLVRQELDHGIALENAVRAGLTAVLTSPRFLYLAEPSDGVQPRSLDDWEIASRLSYLLWSSMPDEQLFELAAAGKLQDPQVRLQQVDRMIADPKIEGFVNGFAAQWLRTETFRNFQPDDRQYPDYDDKLGEAMVSESLEFFREVLKHDLALSNFIDSGFAMLNERLAKHYGIEGVQGDQFRRVPLPDDSHRGGLLAHAGVLMAGSDGNRTKPVSRAVYVREVLFNDPPDPPPPNVGEIEPNIKGKNLTVRERLIQHQEIESCAACHRTLDPYGLALENFDVIGAWREQQTGEGFRARKAPPIDASGKLPDGSTFDGFEQFRERLLAQQQRFHRGLTEKMMVYALGRPLEPGDRIRVDAISDALDDDSATLRTMIKQIVSSPQFLTK
ncbi:DUF1592 domain-containing protein [Roseiconus nitratireducens]|nr:DUF1592 domain-containing protein [Roseiconus nitratireducens]